MKYQVQITDKILKKIERLSRKDKQRIVEAIDFLVEDLRPDGCKKLKGNCNPPRYRIRAGNYRVVYSVQDEVLLILVVKVGHRRMFIKTWASSKKRNAAFNLTFSY